VSFFVINFLCKLSIFFVLILICNNSVQTHPLPCHDSEVVSLNVSFEFSSAACLLYLSFVRPLCPHRSFLSPAASCLNISASASGRRPAAYTFPILVLLFNFPPLGCLPLPLVLRHSRHRVRYPLGLPRALSCLSCRSLPCCFLCVRSHLFPPLFFICLIAAFSSIRVNFRREIISSRVQVVCQSTVYIKADGFFTSGPIMVDRSLWLCKGSSRRVLQVAFCNVAEANFYMSVVGSRQCGRGIRGATVLTNCMTYIRT
jgi:hypothetical protein